MNTKILTKKKLELDKLRPLDKGLKRNLDEWLRIELTYSSNAIEGNTLTRQETALVVEKGIAIGGKSLNEHFEAINHAKALDWIKEFSKKNKTISEKDILRIHSIILSDIDDSNAGFYRRVSVRIAGPRVILPNPLKVPDLMNEFINWLKKNKDLHPVEFAAEAHYRLVTIHPFIDGNGRTARLLMNLILIMNDYPEAIIKKTDRLKYINSLEKAQLGGSKNDYFKIIEKAVESSLDIYLNAINNKSVFLKENNQKLLKIGEIAKQTNETTATIRYWTKVNLLEVAEITPSGYQLYDTEMINRIKKIKDLKKKRYTLEEIKKRLKR
jgi:Fic family protein